MEKAEINMKDSKGFEAISRVRDTFAKYGGRIQKDVREGDISDLCDIAEEVGYQVLFVGVGHKYINSNGKTQEITPDNLVRIGAGKKLFVGRAIGQGGLLVGELSHDVGACLLGVREKRDQEAFVDVKTLNKVVQTSTGKQFSPEELEGMNLISKNENGTYETRVAVTHIFDALIDRKLEYKAIKYIP